YKSDSSVGEINIENPDIPFDWQNELNTDILSEEHIQILIRSILKQAILNDVHEMFFEHVPNGLSVNFRKDSEIINTGQIPSVLVFPFISKLKTLSGLDSSISELPQSGKLIFKAEDLVLTAVISAFPTINGERISLKIYKPPQKLTEFGLNLSQINDILCALNQYGIILVCGASLSGKTHIIYSILSEISTRNINIMTIESISKFNLEKINQCELNENIGFNMDKAMRFIEFQSPDIIYFEGITSKSALDYISSLVFKNKIIITEFLADNMADLNNKLSYADFEMFKPLITCLIFVHSKNRIEVFNKSDLNRFLN
ncbi:MAG: Flp pilus assembly complex ATPase component TadA, partial [Candidatus Gastranaerophilales bacterium]|nr:Flp pilus assembly complex ATPase component TadA [Candidatus Gastranaerophilales bacterium]